MEPKNLSIVDLNTWVAKMFPISSLDWKERVKLTAMFRVKLDDVQRKG